MKFPIKWHKDSLTNMTTYWQLERKLAEETLARCTKAEADIQHYAKQIAEAERRGVNGFDRDRLLKPNAEAVRPAVAGTHQPLVGDSL